MKGSIPAARGAVAEAPRSFYDPRFLLLHSFKAEWIPFILWGSLSDMTEAKMLIAHIPE